MALVESQEGIDFPRDPRGKSQATPTWLDLSRQLFVPTLQHGYLVVHRHTCHVYPPGGPPRCAKGRTGFAGSLIVGALVTWAIYTQGQLLL